MCSTLLVQRIVKFSNLTEYVGVGPESMTWNYSKCANLRHENLRHESRLMVKNALVQVSFSRFSFHDIYCLFMCHFRYNESGQLGAGDTWSRTDSEALLTNVVFSRLDQFHSSGLHLPYFQSGLSGELPASARGSGSPDIASCQNALLAQTPAGLQACPIR